MQRIIQPHVILQLSDLRISVVKEACNLIAWLNSDFPGPFMTFYNPRSESLGGGNGAKYFLLEGLPKLILSKNKLHQEQGHKTMMQILQKQPFIEKILYYLALLVPYDNQYLRLCFSQYLQVIL